MRRHNRRGNVDPYFFILMLQLWQLINRLPYKPPVLLGLVALQVYLYVTSAGINEWGDTVCLSTAETSLVGVFSPISLRAMILSPLLHAHDYHLYCNLSSFLIKGFQLESRYGSHRFAALLVIIYGFWIAVYHALTTFAYNLGYTGWYYQCTVGFSGIIFALKVILSADSPGYQSFYGIRVPMRLAAWAELLLISVFVPESSFVGHLAGIVTGTAYIWIDRVLSKANMNILDLLRDIFLGANYKSSGDTRAEDHGGEGDFGSFFSNIFSRFMDGNFNTPGFNTAPPQYDGNYAYHGQGDRYRGYGPHDYTGRRFH